MKKDHLLFRFLLIMMCLLGTSLSSQAQNITIQGDGTLDKSRMPLGPQSSLLNFKYCMTQFFVQAQELGQEMDLTSLSLRVDSLGTGGTKTRHIVIYLGEVSMYCLQQGSVPSSSMTRMWEGTKNFNTTGSYTFTFTTPYHYSGNNNLVVCIFDSTNVATAPIYFAREANSHSYGPSCPTIQVYSNSLIGVNQYSSSTSSITVVSPTTRPRVVFGTSNRQPVRHVYLGNEWDIKTNNNYTFGNSDHHYSYSQSLITAGELGSASHKFTGMSIKTSSSAFNTSSTAMFITLYLADVTNTRSTTPSSLKWVDPKHLTKVYSGLVTFHGG